MSPQEVKIHLQNQKNNGTMIMMNNETLNKSHEINTGGAFVTNELVQSSIHKEDTIRFVLFLCDSDFFIGAITLLESLSESLQSTDLPPLVLVIGNSTIRPHQRDIMESLGAQVKVINNTPELTNASMQHFNTLGARWPVTIFSKVLVFRPQIVECDVVFYIDLDAIARGNLIRCMNDTLEVLRREHHVDLMAVGSRTYFNNGVLLLRPRDRTYKYIVDMLRNGTCLGRDCNGTTTMMKRVVYTDQDVFIEYTQRFPQRFEPIPRGSALNIEPRYFAEDRDELCSIIHYTGVVKPWSALFRNKTIAQVVSDFPTISNDDVDYSSRQIDRRTPRPAPYWAMKVWSDYWNRLVTHLHMQQKV